jgi:hypothetical protein
MNIFISSTDPNESASNLDDKRVIKMILETTQMLSTSLITLGQPGPYKSTHINHPCSIWVRTTRSNYSWTLEHLSALLKEYTNRYLKIHKCNQYLNYFYQSKIYIPEGQLTSFINCTTYKELEVTEAYKKYLSDKWQTDKRKPTWYKKSKESVS